MNKFFQQLREKAAGAAQTVRRFDSRDWLEVVFLVAVVMCGVVARIKLYPKESGDLHQFLIPWYDYLKEHGGFRAVGDEIGDYTPMYYYFMAFLTYTNIPVTVGIKTFSMLFELIGAFYVKAILEIEYRKSTRPLLGFAVAFLLPTVITNSGAWAQCDGIFTCFVILSLYQFLKGRDLMAMAMFGIAISLKIQAIFFAPFIVAMVLRRKLRFRSLLMIPAVYILSILPATIAGGNFFRLLTVYIRQSGQYSMLNMALPNIWSLLDGVDPNPIGSAGIFLAGGVVLVLMYYFVFGGKEPGKLTVRGAITMAAISCFAVPYLLPHMHERYYFCADMLILILAFCFPKRIWLILSTQFCSFIAVAGNIYGKERLDMRIVALIETINFAVLLLSLREELQQPESKEVVMRFEQPKESK